MENKTPKSILNATVPPNENSAYTLNELYLNLTSFSNSSVKSIVGVNATKDCQTTMNVFNLKDFSNTNETLANTNITTNTTTIIINTTNNTTNNTTAAITTKLVEKKDGDFYDAYFSVKEKMSDNPGLYINYSENVTPLDVTCLMQLQKVKDLAKYIRQRKIYLYNSVSYKFFKINEFQVIRCRLSNLTFMWLHGLTFLKTSCTNSDLNHLLLGVKRQNIYFDSIGFYYLWCHEDHTCS